jgi:hypothetical protein
MSKTIQLMAEQEQQRLQEAKEQRERERQIREDAARLIAIETAKRIERREREELVNWMLQIPAVYTTTEAGNTMCALCAPGPRDRVRIVPGG